MKKILATLTIILLSSCFQNTNKEPTNLVAKEPTNLVTKDCLINFSFCFPDCESVTEKWSFSDSTFMFKSKEGISTKGTWKYKDEGFVELKHSPNLEKTVFNQIEKLKLSNCESFMLKGKKYVK